MAQRVKLPIGRGYYALDSNQYADQTCTNLYPFLPLTQGALSTESLFRTPGCTQTTSTGTGTSRGAHKLLKTGTLLFVNGDALYEMTAISTATRIGTIVGTERVIMADNGETTCIIVPGNTGYFYTDADGLSPITDPVFLDFMAQEGGVKSVALKDGRFIYTTTTEFFVGSTSTVNKGQDFDALDFEDAEVKPDNIVRSMNVKNELYIMGSDSIELYQNTGGTSFPFTRIPGATIDKGIVSPFCIQEYDNSMVFVGGGMNDLPSVWESTGGGADKLSTDAIDTLLQQLTKVELSAITSFTYTEKGSIFVGWHLPTVTIVYDRLASVLYKAPVWHIRSSNGSRWQVDAVLPAFGVNIVNSYNSAKIGKLSREYTDEYGEPITRQFTSGYVQLNGEEFTVSQVELKCATGKGTATGTSGANPTIELEYTKNGGESWHSMGTVSMGRTGEYNKKQQWRRLGRVDYSIAFRLTSTSPIEQDFYELEVTVA